MLSITLKISRTQGRESFYPEKLVVNLSRSIRFSRDFFMVRDPGKTLQTARTFKLGETRSTVRESLSQQDRVDIWRINSRFRGSLDLALNQIAKKANADVSVLNGAGEAIATSKKGGNQAESLNVFLETGTFYVRVRLRGNVASKYALSLSAAPAADQIGDSFETATVLGRNAVQDFVGNNDLNDYLGVRFLVAGQFKLDLTGLSEDANLELYDGNRSLLAASTNSGITPESIQQDLISIAGSPYFVRVFPAPGKETSYTLNYSFTPKAITTTASGLRYIDIAEGTGETPRTGQTVEVQYTGILLDGTQFDSSRDRGVSFNFPIGKGRVIKGWDEGIATLKVGGRRQLIIPPELAYGASGTRGIPPNSTLIFDVEVISISGTPD
jgi:FKBP-type peptidyl-prolyl cis-trans isomerase